LGTLLKTMLTIIQPKENDFLLTFMKNTDGYPSFAINGQAISLVNNYALWERIIECDIVIKSQRNGHGMDGNDRFL
jgi:hypothetical protein